MTNPVAELELTLRLASADAYAIDLRYTPPDSDADARLADRGSAVAHIDVRQLLRLTLDADAYGKELSASLFADPSLLAAFREARRNASSLDAPLRLRLFIDPGAADLHAVRWETLRDPQDGSLLATSERVWFSRYLSSQDMRRVKLRALAELRALVVISAPDNLAEFGLDAIDAASELDRIVTALGTIPITALMSATAAKGSPTPSGPASLDEIHARLRQGYDILYIVAHGRVTDGAPTLYLETDAGTVDAVDGKALVSRINELQHPPRLVVLASCQSAALRPDTNGALSALGPRLAETGVAAVVAMQGNVAQRMIAKLMPAFFKALQEDGQIDHAMAVARGVVRDDPDVWMPALFMRLKSGRVWYTPGFTDAKQRFERWPAVMRRIQQGRCTPILGAGLLESMLGTTREIAQRWADTYHFPMSPHARDDLPQVAQYLSTYQGDSEYPRSELATYVSHELLHRYGEHLPADLRAGSLATLLKSVGEFRRAEDPAEPHRVLAGLPFPIYVTTNPDDLMAEALRDGLREPRVELCRWNDAMTSRSIYESEPTYRPSAQQPLVYHLFGQLSDPRSVVLTEDDYFDYLIGMTRNDDLIPAAVLRALTDTSLLFLGFQIDDWNFRVLLRSVMNQDGGRREMYPHVAVQIDPEEGRFSDPERARRYLESSFGHADISVFWGSVDDFVAQLQAQTG